MQPKHQIQGSSKNENGIYRDLGPFALSFPHIHSPYYIQLIPYKLYNEGNSFLILPLHLITILS